jgi:hypothetical protein
MAEGLDAEVMLRTCRAPLMPEECSALVCDVVSLHSCLRQVKRHKQLVAGGHEGGMEELKDFVDKKACQTFGHYCILWLFSKIALQLLEGQERKRLIDLHMQLSQVIFAELKKRNTSDLSFLEESIIGNSSSDAKKQVMAILSPPATSAAAPDKVFHPMDKLRLVKSQCSSLHPLAPAHSCLHPNSPPTGVDILDRCSAATISTRFFRFRASSNWWSGRRRPASEDRQREGCAAVGQEV